MQSRSVNSNERVTESQKPKSNKVAVTLKPRRRQRHKQHEPLENTFPASVEVGGAVLSPEQCAAVVRYYFNLRKQQQRTRAKMAVERLVCVEENPGPVEIVRLRRDMYSAARAGMGHKHNKLAMKLAQWEMHIDEVYANGAHVAWVSDPPAPRLVGVELNPGPDLILTRQDTANGSQSDGVMYTASEDVQWPWAVSSIAAIPNENVAGYAVSMVYVRPKGAATPVLTLEGQVDMGVCRLLQTSYAGSIDTVSPTSPTTWSRKHNSIYLNDGDEVVLSILGDGFAAMFISCWLELVGIEPNPGPMFSAIDAAVEDLLTGRVKPDNEEIDPRVMEMARLMGKLPANLATKEETQAVTKSVVAVSEGEPHQEEWEAPSDIEDVPRTLRGSTDGWEKPGRGKGHRTITAGTCGKALAQSLNSFARKVKSPGADYGRYHLLCAVFSVGPSRDIEDAIPDCPVLKRYAERPVEERKKNIKRRKGRQGGKKKEENEQKKEFKPVDADVMEERDVIGRILDSSVEDPLGTFALIKRYRAVELLDEYKARLEIKRGQRTGDPICTWVQYALGEFLVCSDLYDELSKDTVMNRFLSRDFIRNIKPKSMQLATLIEDSLSGLIDEELVCVELNPGPPSVPAARLVGIEPNPGPMNSEAGDVVASTSVTLTTESVPSAQPTMGSELPVEVGGTTLLDMIVGKAADAVSRSSTVFNTNVNTVDATIKNWAQVQHLKPSTYNKVGYKSFASFYETYLGTHAVTDDAAASFVVNTYKIVDPSGSHNIALSFSKAGAALLEAIQAGDLVLASQIIRISTSVSNGDALQRAMVDGGNKYQSGVAGSFVSILLRLLQLAYMELPLLGPENSSMVGNSHMQLNSPIVRGLAPGYFNLSDRHNAAAPTINARMCTYTDYTSARAGTRTDFNAAVTPDKWGVTCAVVPIQTDALRRGQMAAAYTLAHLDGPYRQVTFECSEVLDDATPSAGNQDVEMLSQAANTRIRAIDSDGTAGNNTYNVLYVLANVTNNPGDIQLTIGTGANAVNISLNNNGPTGAAVNIQPGLDGAGSGIQSPNWIQGVTDAIQYWQELLGNEEDLRSALLVAADAFHNLGAPMLMEAGVPYNAFYGNAAPIWNDNGYQVVTGPDWVNACEALTGPLGMIVTSDIAEVRNLSRILVRVGTLDPNTEVDVVAGLVTPVYRQTFKLPQNLAGIGSMLRKLARIESCLMDAMMRDDGNCMDQLFNPQGGALGAASQSTIYEAWRHDYGVLNMILYKGLRATSMTYDGSAMANYEPAWWQAIPANTTLGWARVPGWYMLNIGVGSVDQIPQKFTTTPYKDYSTEIGYPAFGDTYEVVHQTAKVFGADKQEMEYASLAQVFGASRYPLESILTTKSGTLTYKFGYPVQQPSLGRGVALALANFGIIRASNADLVDPPMLGSVPVYNAFVANNVFYGFYGNSVGFFTREPVREYTMHLMSLTTAINEQFILSDSTATALSARRNALGGSFLAK